MEINVCSSCGGKVEFSPQDKALKCVNCGNIYPIEYKQQVVKHPIMDYSVSAHLDAWLKENRAYKCKVCGAQVTFNKYDIATNCQYCHTSSLMPLKDLPGFKPEKVIPFKIDKNRAKDEFKYMVLKRKFLPNDFRKNLPTTDMGATYLSAFNFECFVSASYKGRQRISSTERDRNGRTRTVTSYRYFSGNIEKQFDNLVVEASDKINQDEIASILPYDFSESYDYDNKFIKGYNVGYYNQTIAEAQEVAKQDALHQVEQAIRRKYSSIDSLTVNPTYSNIKYNYTLLPAYFVNFSYKNKPYINVMNGQMGAIGGKLPKSPIKITLFVLMILLVLGLPILFILLAGG